MILQLNGFLIRKGLSPFAAISPSIAPGLDVYSWSGTSLDKLDSSELDLLEAAVSGDIIVAIYQHTSSPPPWQLFIEGQLGLPGFAIDKLTIGAIIFCAMVDGDDEGELRWLAWSFGACSKAISRGATDPRFGLIATLNGLAMELEKAGEIEELVGIKKGPELRLLKYRTTAPYFQQTGHQASKNIPVDGFRIDKMSDLVSTVGGRTSDAVFRHVSGGRSLSFKSEILNMDNFLTLSIEALYRSNVTLYKDIFGWVDNISLVEELTLVDQLREIVLQKILDPDEPASVDVLLPDDLPDMRPGQSIQYVLFPQERRKSASRLTLTVGIIAQHLQKLKKGDMEDFLDRELRFLDESYEHVASATVLECICADLIVDDVQYIAYDGDFYRVDPDFVRKIDEQLAQVDISTLPLPPYKGGGEPQYNNAVRDSLPTSFVVLDGQLVRLPGEHGVEPCDILGPSGELIHVKRKGRSSTLSHLFSQAENSCTLLWKSAEAREQLMKMVQESSRSEQLTEQITKALDALKTRENGLSVIFAFLGDWRGRSISALPLFSRIGLGKAIEAISLLGYKASVQLVDISRTA